MNINDQNSSFYSCTNPNNPLHEGLQNLRLELQRHTENVPQKIKQIHEDYDREVSVGNMFELQMKMNSFSQISEVTPFTKTINQYGRNNITPPKDLHASEFYGTQMPH